MKNSSKKIFSLLLIMIMLISSTGVVNAAYRYGNVYGANYYVKLTFSGSGSTLALNGYMSGDAEASGEAAPELYFYMVSYTDLGNFVGSGGASCESGGSGVCSKTMNAVGAGYAYMYPEVDGYEVASLYEEV